MKRLPVIDAAEKNNGTIYGHATTPRGARRVASRSFADPVKRIVTAN
jgi:hypothetical protein